MLLHSSKYLQKIIWKIGENYVPPIFRIIGKEHFKKRRKFQFLETSESFQRITWKIMNQQIFRSFAKDSLKENRIVCSFKLPNYSRRNIWKREESYVSSMFRILAKDHLDDRRK